MTQQDSVPNTHEGLRKVGYAAVGLPSRARREAKRRFHDTATNVATWRNRIFKSAREIVRECAEEGESLVNSIAARTRREFAHADDTIRRESATARETGRGLLAVATQPIVPMEAIDGVGPAYARKLAAAGVTSTAALVARCGTDSAVARLSRQAGISESLVSAWVQSADLSRIDGVGADHMELLNAAGIGAVEQLADIDPKELHERLAAVNDEYQLVAAVPGEATLRDWATQAGALG